MGAGQRAYNAAEEALSLRASFLSSNGDEETSKEIKAKEEVEKEQLISAGISAVSIIPFGAIWKFMGKGAQAAKLGSLARVGQISAEENVEAIAKLRTTINALNKPDVEKVLSKVVKEVSEEDYGTFIGHLSDVTPEIRERIITGIKNNPSKAKAAITEGAEAARRTCK